MTNANNTTPPEHTQLPLLWLDLETTGLNPMADTILEVAVIIPTRLYENVWVRRMMPNLSIWDKSVVEMHLKNGLVADCVASTMSLEDIEDALLRVLIDPKYMLAGNSIHFDRAFIDRCMPKVAAKLHYRMLDMTSVESFLMRQGLFTKYVKKKAHRAMSDIKESLEQYEFAADTVSWR